jgi:hypothetical protein
MVVICVPLGFCILNWTFGDLKIPIFMTSSHPLYPRQRGIGLVHLREGDSREGDKYTLKLRRGRDISINDKAVLYTASLIRYEYVIPAEAGMTNRVSVM